jgi:hypothetical protein
MMISTKSSSPGARRGRRGFALIFAISVLALLLTFLIAAQGSVLGSIRLISRSGAQMKNSLHVDEALGRAYRALGSTTQDSGSFELGSGGDLPQIEVGYERLGSTSEFYASLPGIDRYREGDALVSLTTEGAAASQRYLINIRGNRAGAIRVL